MPKGYKVLTEQEHFDLTQLAAQAKADSMLSQMMAGEGKIDFRHLRDTFALVMTEIDETGKGLEEVRRLRAEAEREALLRRRIGRLATKSEVRRELGQLYRESYGAQPEQARHFTRLAYMLDCLSRLATDGAPVRKRNAKHRDNTGQTGGE